MLRKLFYQGQLLCNSQAVQDNRNKERPCNKSEKTMYMDVPNRVLLRTLGRNVQRKERNPSSKSRIDRVQGCKNGLITMNIEER